MPGATPVFGIPYPFETDPGSVPFGTFVTAIENVVAGTQVLIERKTNLPSAQASFSAAIVAASGVLTTATFTTVNWDLGPGTDLIAAPSTTFRIPFAGVYWLFADECRLTGMTTVNLWDWLILVNGAAGVYQITQRPTTAGSGDGLAFGGLWLCAAGDLVSLQGSFYGTGNATNIAGRLTVTLIAPA